MELAWNTQKNQMRDVKGKEMEQDRKGEISNPDIDLERTENNYDLVDLDATLYRRVKNRVDALKEEGSRVQKNSVVMYSNILTVPKEQAELWGVEKTGEYFKSCYDFFCNEFGKENVVSAKVHQDETTPHMHLHFVPVNKENGKLQARVAMNKEKITCIHDALPKFLQDRGFEVVRASGKTKDSNIENIHEYKEKQRELEAVKALDREIKEQLSHIEDTKTNLAAINAIESRKFEKGGFFTDKRVEISPEDYKTLIDAGRQNVKLRKRNYELLSKAGEVRTKEIAVARKEKELDARSEQLAERERALDKREETLDRTTSLVADLKKRTEAEYMRQVNVNELLEKSEARNTELELDNKSLTQSVSRLEAIVESLRSTVQDYQNRLRSAFQSVKNVVQAMGMLKYDNEDYRANLTEKQGHLVDAVTAYGAEQAKKEGFHDLAEGMEARIGISKGIEDHLPKERKFSMMDIDKYVQESERRNNARASLQRSNQWDMER